MKSFAFANLSDFVCAAALPSNLTNICHHLSMSNTRMLIGSQKVEKYHIQLQSYTSSQNIGKKQYCKWDFNLDNLLNFNRAPATGHIAIATSLLNKSDTKPSIQSPWQINASWRTNNISSACWRRGLSPAVPYWTPTVDRCREIWQKCLHIWRVTCTHANVYAEILCSRACGRGEWDESISAI